jgi:Ca2+-binding RTX toxin-like protein
VRYTSATAGVTLNLASTSAQNTGGAGTDTISNVENVTGSSFNDALTGTAGGNVIDGGVGNDVLNGGCGNDTLIGGAGSDTMIGGSGVDTADYSGAAAGVTVQSATVNGTPGFAGTGGEAAGDILFQIENISGSNFDDVLNGNSADNVIDGGMVNDTITGGGGNDTLISTGGNDTMRGGTGVDTFRIVAGIAAIEDYELGEDIQISSLTATQYDSVTQILTLTGNGLGVNVIGVLSAADAQFIIDNDVFAVS